MLKEKKTFYYTLVELKMTIIQFLANFVEVGKKRMKWIPQTGYRNRDRYRNREHKEGQ